MTIPFVVGAYASLPPTQEDQEKYYAALAEQPWVQGLEVPFQKHLHEDNEWLAKNMHDSFATNVLTPIPGVMWQLGEDPNFGLASPDEGGRAAALDYLLKASWEVKAFNDALGRQFFSYIAIHSAPREHADPDALLTSLEVAAAWDWDGATLVIEHCDAYDPELAPQKGFLSLRDELDVIARLETGPVLSSINWGRSAIEGRTAELPLQHVKQVADAGVLGGVIFSGAHELPNDYGPPWTDDHVALDADEPTSIMTATHVKEAADVARQAGAHYLGAKLTLNEHYTIDERLAILGNVAIAAGAQSPIQAED